MKHWSVHIYLHVIAQTILILVQTSPSANTQCRIVSNQYNSHNACKTVLLLDKATIYPFIPSMGGWTGSYLTSLQRADQSSNGPFLITASLS